MNRSKTVLFILVGLGLSLVVLNLTLDGIKTEDLNNYSEEPDQEQQFAGEENSSEISGPIVDVVVFAENGYPQSDAPERYQEFLDSISDRYELAGAEVEFNVLDWRNFPKGGDCLERARFDQNSEDWSIKPDVAICYADVGGGGFFGSKINMINHNIESTDDYVSGRGQAYKDVATTAHEFGHYFGVPDLYGYPESMPMKWMDGSIMDYPFCRDCSFKPEEADILNHNIEQFSEGGRKAITYRRVPSDPPSYRKHRTKRSTNIILEMNDSMECYVIEIHDNSRTHNENRTVYSVEKTDDNEFRFKMGDFSQNRGIQLQCEVPPSVTEDSESENEFLQRIHNSEKLVDGETYWVPFYQLDQCFKNQGYSQIDSCTMKCDSEGDWCEVS